jgi:hypothetical protein
MVSTTITIVLDDDRNKMQVIFYRRILNKDIMDNLHQQGSTPPPITETYSMCTDYDFFDGAMVGGKGNILMQVLLTWPA